MEEKEPEFQVDFGGAEDWEHTQIKTKGIIFATVCLLSIIGWLLHTKSIPSWNEIPYNDSEYRYEIKNIKGVECIFLKRGSEFISVDCNDNEMEKWQN